MSSQAKTSPGQPSSDDYDPSSDWVRSEETDTLCVYLPGFKKEDLKVQVDGYGNLRTSGERPDIGGRPIRFWKDFRLPQNCKVDEIRAKFEKDTLVIMIPKLVAATPAASEPKPASGKHDKNQQAYDPKLPRTEPEPETPDRRAPATTIKESEITDTPKMEEKVDDRGERKQKEEVANGSGGDAMPEKQQVSGDLKQATSKPGVGEIVMGQRKTLLLNMVVSVIVVVGLAIYMNYKFKDVKDKQ